MLLSVARYGLSYITLNYYSRWAQTTYRLAFLSAVATYGIVVYKAHKARLRSSSNGKQTALALLSDENVQYLSKSGNGSYFIELFLTADSDLLGLVVLETDSSGTASVYRLLDLPRCDLHPNKPDPDYPASQDYSLSNTHIPHFAKASKPERSRQLYWKICQGVL